MADRFPSLDDFDAGQTEAQPADTSSNDFLARERAALGDDAEQFTSSADNAATVEEGSDDDNDLLGGGGGNYGGGSSSYPTNGNNDFGGDDDLGDFESSFPAVDHSNAGVGAGGTVTGNTAPFQASSSSLRGYDDLDTEEPQVLRDWREKRDAQIQHRDEVSASKKAETVKAAQTNIDEFYENYNNRKDKGIAQTRKEAEEFLKNREDTTSGGTSWERIAKLVDLSGKGASGGASGTQKAKMRELLVSLRKDEKAPGASGV